MMARFFWSTNISLREKMMSRSLAQVGQSKTAWKRPMNRTFSSRIFLPRSKKRRWSSFLKNVALLFRSNSVKASISIHLLRTGSTSFSIRISKELRRLYKSTINQHHLVLEHWASNSGYQALIYMPNVNKEVSNKFSSISWKTST